MYFCNIHMAANNIQFTRIEIQIAKYMFKHYKDRYNARQLASILDINHAHTNKLCNLLANKHLLIKEEIGNSAFFSYEYNNKLAIKFMEYILSLEEKEFPKWLSVLSHSLIKFEVVEKPIRYVDIAEKDILLNKEDKIFLTSLDFSALYMRKTSISLNS